MTLGAAWIRNVGNVRELIVASDSRLSGGSPERWDACPKILTLARTDAVVSFAGVTELAYPAMLQMNRAIETHPAMVERRFDVTQVATLFEDVLNQMIGLVKTESPDSLLDSLRRTTFLLSGYSWKLSEFRIWHYRWSDSESRYKKNRCRTVGPASANQTFVFIGDAAKRARNKLISQLTQDFTRSRGAGLNMEPLNILEHFINDPADDDVGGAPQVVKVYRHMNVEPFAVIWPNSSAGVPTFAGRPLLDYEKPFAPPFDLNTPEVNYRHLTPRPAPRVDG